MINLNPTLTAAGFALFRGEAPGFSVAITHVAFGAQKYDPLGFESSLKSELVRFPIDGAALISPSAIQVGVLMKNSAPDGRTANDKWIGEIGFYAGDTLFAVLSQAAAYLFYKSPDIDIPVTYVLDFSVLPAGSITVNNDAQSASIALASSYAQTAAKTALNAQQVISSTYYGRSAVEPATRPDGTARQSGDRYFDTNAKAEKTWTGTTWYAANLSAATLASRDGAGSVGATWFKGVFGKLSDLATSAGSSLIGFLQDGVGAVARSIQDKLREQYNVRDYGDFIADDFSATVIKANQLTINRAIAAASVAGGGVVNVPSGTFGIAGVGANPADRAIVLRDNVHLKGAGQKATVLRRAGPVTLLINQPYPADGAYGSGPCNIAVSDLTLDGNAAFSPLHPGNISLWLHCDNVDIRRVTFLNCPGLHSIDLNGCRNFVVEHCRFEGHDAALTAVFLPDDPGYYPEAIQVSADTYNSTIDGKAPMNLRVAHCYFGPSDTLGSVAVAMGNHSFLHGRKSEDITFEHNIVDSPLYHGVRVFNWKRARISNNKFKSCPYAVFLSSSYSARDWTGTPSGVSSSGEDVTISHNSFIDTMYCCVNVSAGHVSETSYEKWRDIKILHNDVIGNITSCTPFVVRWVSQLSVIGNKLRGQFNRGMYFGFCDTAHLLHNQIENTVLEGVYIVEDTQTAFINKGLTFDWVIAGNILRNLGYSGINLQAIINASIHGNVFVDPGTLAPGKRPSIGITAFARDIDITGNRFSGGTYGVDASASCSNIRMGPNTVLGTDSGAYRNLASGESTIFDMSGTKGAIVPLADNLDAIGAVAKRYAKGFFTDLRVRNNMPVMAVLAQSGVAVPHTGTTDETTLATIIVPGGLLGPNDALEVETYWTHTSSSMNKTLRVKFGGTAFFQPIVSTSVQTRGLTTIRNAGSLAAQFGGISSTAVTSGIGGSAAAMASSAANTAINQTLTITAQLVGTAENITLLGYTVKYVPAP